VTDLLKVHEDWPTRDIGFWCPGCGCMHWIPTAGEKGWTWNGSKDVPTVTPSLRRTTPDHNVDGEALPPHCCHLFVREGQLQFLADCTHALAGQTVSMEPVEGRHLA
jgi:hypothetical protein